MLPAKQVSTSGKPPDVKGMLSRVVIPTAVPVSMTTKACLRMLGYPLKHVAKKSEDDISGALDPLLKFVMALLEANDQIAELEKEGNLDRHTIYTQTRTMMPHVNAPSVFKGIFSSWGIELIETEGKGSSRDIPEGTILMEINVVANAVRYFERIKLKHCPRRKDKNNMLWPDEFSDAEQTTLRKFVKDQVNLIDGALETPESRLATIWEI